MTIFNFALKRSLGGKLDIFMLLLLPVVTVFISVETWLPIPFGFQLYGLLLLFMASKICKIMMIDRESRVVLRIQASPISHLRYLSENLLAYTLILTVINAVVVGLGVIYYGSGLLEPVKLFIIFNVFSVTSIGISIAWYALFHHTESAYSILSGLFMAMAMLGGMFWPYDIMPEVVQRVIQILPTYWYSVGLRQILLEGGGGNLYFTLGVLLLFGFAFILLGSRRRLS